MSKVLLTPGPCMTSETVRQASALPDLNHRDPEYLSLIRETKERLLEVYGQTQTDWHAYLLGGSGTLAVEAMITSCVKTGPVLILENGYYSERIRDIFEIHRIPFETVSHGWLEPWDFERINAKLGAQFEAVIGTHNETTTGRLNDIARLGELCRNYGVTCLVDAMSSFGADAIDLSNLSAVTASANKCLHGLPGVGFVLVHDSLVETVQSCRARSYYMNLARYAGDVPPLTPPVPALSAFRQALREYPGSGSKTRGDDYADRAAYLRQELCIRGFCSAVPFDEMSCTLSTMTLPAGFTFDDWFEANLAEGFVIYGCKGELRDKYFQVSNMGAVTMNQLESWIVAVDRILGR